MAVNPVHNLETIYRVSWQSSCVNIKTGLINCRHTSGNLGVCAIISSIPSFETETLAKC